MSGYRLFFMDRFSGHIEHSREFIAADDSEAIAVAAAEDLAAVEAYARAADRLLFDARAPREATRPGGLGTAFDWRLLEDIEPGVPALP